MTRDEHRAKCIEAMKAAYVTRVAAGDWEFVDLMLAVFDSLANAGVRVDPVEATEEMRAASMWKQPKHRYYVDEEWRRMSAAGDLTNPPEGKP